MATWCIPIIKIMTYEGELLVKADSQEEAIAKARYEYHFEEQGPFANVDNRPIVQVSFGEATILPSFSDYGFTTPDTKISIE